MCVCLCSMAIWSVVFLPYRLPTLVFPFLQFTICISASSASSAKSHAL